ncbi:hypothetical protein [Dactylosporangium sp. NPDC048998]|uniref:hypothetical protein n=1 Tax=Dactylosporangium sp. NPDC048998 TaxID=3363976 RepID=UPI00371971D3
MNSNEKMAEGGVDVGDDHSLAGAGRVAELRRPSAVGAGQAEERRRGDGVDGAPLVLPDPQDAGRARDALALPGVSAAAKPLKTVS